MDEPVALQVHQAVYRLTIFFCVLSAGLPISAHRQSVSSHKGSCDKVITNIHQ